VLGVYRGRGAPANAVAYDSLVTPQLGTGRVAERNTAFAAEHLHVAGSVRVLRRGETLFDVGGAADEVFAVESGLLALSLPLRSGRERIVALAGPGEFIGALAPGRHRHAERAHALSPTVTAVALPRDSVQGEVERLLFAALHARVEGLRRRLEESERPVADRLASTLLDLGSRYGHSGEDGVTRLTLPLTHEHLAALIGAARETTSTVLSELRARGLVEGTRGRYRFRESALRAALEAD
jgi:CRP/FNR family transcriptional regulator, cyclic AMP receptor protein